MNKSLQIFLIIGSIITLITIIVLTRKNKMNNRYSVIWILWSIFTLIISVCPKIVYVISEKIGFEKPVNAIFLIMIFSLFCLIIYLFIKISKLNNDVFVLNYEISKMKKSISNKEQE